MTRKKYTLHFNIGDQTIPVNFDVFIGGSKASEVPVTTAWTETFTGTIDTIKQDGKWRGTKTFNFLDNGYHVKGIDSLIVAYNGERVDDYYVSARQIRNDKGEITEINIEYANPEGREETFDVTVVAKIDPDYYLPSVWDRLVYLKTKFGA